MSYEEKEKLYNLLNNFIVNSDDDDVHFYGALFLVNAFPEFIVKEPVEYRRCLCEEDARRYKL